MKFVRFGIAFACWAIMTGTAFAGCVQTDLAGRWELYFPAQEPNPLGGANYSHCRLNVDSTGAILESGSYCRTLESARSAVVNGTMTLKSPVFCSFQFQFDSPNIVPGYKGLHGTLTKDLSSAAGVMTFPVNGAQSKPTFIFMMVRL